MNKNNEQDDIPPDLYDTSSSRFSEASLFHRAPDGRTRVSCPWRTTLVALFLFAIGFSFLLTGVLHFWDRDRGTSIAFIVVGSISFIPGAYVSFNLIQTLRGAPGFHLSECTFGINSNSFLNVQYVDAHHLELLVYCSFMND